MKVSDYVVHVLVEHGVRDIFLVSGGGIMHLLDAVGSHPDLRYFATYHEQAAVAAAEGYARRTGKLGVALVTVGPGAANAASALPGAWVDSIPILVLAGQVRTDMIADYRTQRQRGPQEANTLEMARPVTKLAASVSTPALVRAQLETAIATALSGRPGPVWLEFPVDITALDIDPAQLTPAFHPSQQDPGGQNLQRDAENVAKAISRAQRPLIVPGNGVRLAGAEPLLRELLEATGIPAAVPFTAKDLIAEDDPWNAGVFGTAGQRRANFAIQNSDLILCLGAGLNAQKIGYNVTGFAPHAHRIIVDIDEVQLREGIVVPDTAILADVRDFIPALSDAMARRPVRNRTDWFDAIAHWRRRYPLITPDYLKDVGHVNSYVFIDYLADALRPDDTIVTGAGLDVVSTYQAFRVKRGQRVLISGWGSMGWDLPMSIGAAIGSGNRIITVTGDGSAQWNVQELLTIKRYELPIKIFVFNNAGFSSIRATQSAFFASRFVGSDPKSGVITANFAKLADAYDLAYVRIESNNDVAAGIQHFLSDNRAGICELLVAAEQSVSPKASAFRRADGTFESRPLEDMAPFLSRDELDENMQLFDRPAAQREHSVS